MIVWIALISLLTGLLMGAPAALIVFVGSLLLGHLLGYVAFAVMIVCAWWEKYR